MKTAARKPTTYSVTEAVELLKTHGFTNIHLPLCVATLKTRCHIRWEISSAGKEFHTLRFAQGKYKGNYIGAGYRPDHR